MQQQMDSCITASKEFPLFLLVQYTLEENNWQTFKRHLKETLLSSNVDPMGSPPKVPLWQLCQETNTFFRLLVASNHQVGDQMIKKRHLALAETTRESRQRGIAMTMSSLKKRKNHLNKSYPPKQSPILMLLWIMQKNLQHLPKILLWVQQSRSHQSGLQQGLEEHAVLDLQRVTQGTPWGNASESQKPPDVWCKRPIPSHTGYRDV